MKWAAKMGLYLLAAPTTSAQQCGWINARGDLDYKETVPRPETKSERASSHPFQREQW